MENYDFIFRHSSDLQLAGTVVSSEVVPEMDEEHGREVNNVEKEEWIWLIKKCYQWIF